MSDFLWQTFHRLITELDTTLTHRFLYDQINLDDRLTGIIGPRGVGKTTLLLQLIRDHLYQEGRVIYFSADATYFNEKSILTFVDELYRTQNIRYFFIDEIHKYANWSQEIKNIYDAFPQAKLFFSGSPSIDLVTGSYDLSRRAKLLDMPGLSFREYLNIKTGHSFTSISLDQLIDTHQQLAAQLSQIGTITQHFIEYALFGYYPIVFEGRDNLYPALSHVIDKTIYEDIANFYSLKTSNLSHFKRIINFLATIPPGHINTNNLARHLTIDNKTADHYLDLLQRTGIIRMLYPIAHGNQALRKPAKIYLDNTTLLAAVNTFLSEQITIGTQRELLFLQCLSGASIPVFSPKHGDFQVNEIIFEVGGKNKTREQIKHHQGKKIVVKNDILIGRQNEIPLYLFGFLY